MAGRARVIDGYRRGRSVPTLLLLSWYWIALEDMHR
jgi:hypothetical protein